MILTKDQIRALENALYFQTGSDIELSKSGAGIDLVSGTKFNVKTVDWKTGRIDLVFENRIISYVIYNIIVGGDNGQTQTDNTQETK